MHNSASGQAQFNTFLHIIAAKNEFELEELPNVATGENVKAVDHGSPDNSVPKVDEAAVPEKLADDVVKLPLWRRVLYTMYPKLQKSKNEMP